LIIAFFVSGPGIFAQWCIPVITQTFNHGLRNVALNGTPAIDRTSGLAENYINTQISTTLIRGNQYSGSVSLGFGVFCGAGMIRVWIDFNRDYDFDDAGELVFTSDFQSTQSPIPFNFTVPSDAYIGTTRMRVLDKMQPSCGHTMPTACNIPPDPIGFHGEVEDYDIILTNPTGLVNLGSSVPDRFALYQNYPNPFNPNTEIEFDISAASDVNLVIYDMTGREVTALVDEFLQPGQYKIDWNAGGYSSGMYIYKLAAGNFYEVKKMILVK
jgi:hypothetical protein